MKISFQDNLITLMKSERVTQTVLSANLGVAQSAVSAWISGKKEPNLKNLWLIADFFDVDIDYLIGRKN